MHHLYIDVKEKLNSLFITLKDHINISFEFFPPRTIEMNNIFWDSMHKLSKFKPNFVSVTHSSNYGGYKHTYKLVKEIKKNTNLDVAPHLTCIGVTQNILYNLAQDYWYNGIRRIVALRGDININQRQSIMYAADLVSLLKKVGDFDISVAAYPETHPEAQNSYADLVNLKKKIDAGANRAITQFFFNIENYLRFRDKCVSIGITIDIVPGILPIHNFHKLQNFAAITNVTIPNWMIKIFNGLNHNSEICKIISTIIIVETIKILYKEGVNNFHFYTLNRADITCAVCHILGI